MPGFQLKYPADKPYPWPYFTPIVLALAVVCFAGLAVLNVALVGYETVTVFQPDFNATQSFWYHRFGLGIQAPGTLCDPRDFNSGATFTTNYSLFEWNLVTVANDSSRSLVYRGSTLETCDVIALYMDAHLQPRSADLAAVITCDDVDGFHLLATTSFSVGLLSGKYSPPLLGITPERFGVRNMSTERKSRSSVLNLMMQLARDDFTPRWDAILRANNTQYPIIISGNGFFPPCPASLGTDAPCANIPPPFNINSTTIVFSNADHVTFDGFLPISDTNQPLIPSNSDLYRPVNNLAQTIMAAVRIDLGNPSPNNFILHPSTLNATLSSTFPASNLLNASASVLYQANARPDLYGIQASLPLTLEGPANIQVVYSCQFQQIKTPGSAFISVLVATLSMFSTGWGLCMFLAAYLAERKESKQTQTSQYVRVPDPTV